MKNNRLIFIIPRLFLTLSFLLFSSLAPFAHFHESSHREFEHAEFHLHIADDDDDRECRSADEEQKTDDHHLFELSYEAYTYIVPILHQGFSAPDQVKNISRQTSIYLPWSCFTTIPANIFNFERGSPPEVVCSRITPHFFTDLSPPLA